MREMSILADGLVTAREYDDFDAMAAAAPAWNLEFTQLGMGRFGGSFEAASTSELQIARFRSSSSLLIAGGRPRGSCGVGLVLSAPFGARPRGKNIDPLRSAPGHLTDGEEAHFIALGPLEIVTVVADRELFERHMLALYGRTLRSLGPDWFLRVATDAPDCAQRGRAMLGLQSVLLSGAASTPDSRRRLQECTLHILLDGLQTDATRTAFSAPQRRRVARAAEEVLRARLDDPPSLRELCEEVGAAQRTLHHSFQEAFGIAPKSYLRALRLSAAHRRLRRGEGPVTTVASDLGMFQFGRFALEYRAMFGETPSTTLRASGNAAPSASHSHRRPSPFGSGAGDSLKQGETRLEMTPVPAQPYVEFRWPGPGTRAGSG
jgi:AraC family ethanolamine operon transcriptional activator